MVGARGGAACAILLASMAARAPPDARAPGPAGGAPHLEWPGFPSAPPGAEPRAEGTKGRADTAWHVPSIALR